MNVTTKIVQPLPTLLVVDDDPHLRFTTVRILEQAGYTVLEGATAAEALALTRAHRPALVLLDVILPDGDGREVSRQLKTDPALTGVPVLLVSGLKISPADQAYGLSEGLADGYLLLPVSAPVLLGRVESLLRLRATQEELRESEQAYRNQFAANSMAMLLLDATDGAIIDANAAALRFYGYPREQLLTMRITDINTLPAAEVRQAMASVSQEQGVRFEFQHRLADGSVREVEVSASQIQFGKRQVLHSIIYDITARKQAEELLWESEERFRVVWDVSSDAMALSDPAGTVIEANPAYSKLYGYPREAVVGHSFAVIFPPEHRPAAIEQYRAIFADTELIPPPFEALVRRADGVERVVESRISFIYQNGRRIAMLSIIHDITARKQAQETIRRAGQRFEALVRNAPDGIVLVGRDGSMIFASPAAKRIFGFGADNPVIANPAEFTHPDDLAMVLAALDDLRRLPSQVTTLQYRFQHHNGSWRWVESTFSNLLDEPEVEAIAINFRDITERKRAEAALRDSEARWQAIINTSPDGISIVSMDGVIQFVSNKLLAMHGYDRPEDMVGKSLFEFLDAAYYETATTRVQEMLNGHYTGVAEYRLIKKDGSHFYVDINAEVLRDPAGQPSNLFFVERDATARKQAEAEQAKLESQNRQLQKTESLGRMAGAIAHHFNNQLQAVMGNLELAMTGRPQPEIPDKNLSQAMLAAHRAAEMSSLMLVYLVKS